MTVTKPKVISEISGWHRTAFGLLTFGIVELGLTYGLASVAVDRGTLWWYILALIAFVGVLQNFTKLIGKAFYGHKPPKA